MYDNHSSTVRARVGGDDGTMDSGHRAVRLNVTAAVLSGTVASGYTLLSLLCFAWTEQMSRVAHSQRSQRTHCSGLAEELFTARAFTGRPSRVSCRRRCTAADATMHHPSTAPIGLGTKRPEVLRMSLPSRSDAASSTAAHCLRHYTRGTAQQGARARLHTRRRARTSSSAVLDRAGTAQWSAFFLACTVHAAVRRVTYAAASCGCGELLHSDEGRQRHAGPCWSWRESCVHGAPAGAEALRWDRLPPPAGLHPSTTVT